MSRHELKFRILDIIRGTTVDGPGFRTAIYMAGCSHHCPGCHNPQSWDFKNGTEMSLEEILDIVREEDFDVTLTGGDPLCSPEAALTLARSISMLGYSVWLYTGYTIEEIRLRKDLYKILHYLEAIVDGPYDENLYDSNLQFRGSSNQRIIFL